MAVGEIRGSKERFPVGLRVLAVDDAPICLKLLEALLRKCQYHVTTASQARVALTMLKESTNRFDLVISDVYLADMDGFKFLEFIGAEIDLPVIMLCVDNDPELVRKGVIHGACDYLVKPVKMEELRNIWQHVVRRKKLDTTNINTSSDQAKANPTSGEERPFPFSASTKFIKKRKDDKNVKNESDDPATGKKRVVWAPELHQKFLAAVHQLGLENAVPKKILDLMIVEGVTRENVASHLQKYRLNLKKNNSGASQHSNMANLGVKDPFPICTSSVNVLRGAPSLAGARLANNRTSIAYTNFCQRIPSPRELHVPQQIKDAPTISTINESRSFASLSASTDPTATICGSGHLLNNNLIMLSQGNLPGGGYGIPFRSGSSYFQYSRARLNDGSFLSDHPNIEDGFTSQADDEFAEFLVNEMDNDETIGIFDFSFDDPSPK